MRESLKMVNSAEASLLESSWGQQGQEGVGGRARWALLEKENKEGPVTLAGRHLLFYITITYILHLDVSYSSSYRQVGAQVPMHFACYLVLLLMVLYIPSSR